MPKAGTISHEDYKACMALEPSLATVLVYFRSFWLYRRQPFPYRIMEGLPVMREQSERHR